MRAPDRRFSALVPQEFAEQAERPRTAPVDGAALPRAPGRVRHAWRDPAARRRDAPCRSGRTAAGRPAIQVANGSVNPCFGRFDRVAAAAAAPASRAAAACCASTTGARPDRATPRRAGRDRRTARGLRAHGPSTSRRDRAAAATRDRRASRAGRRRLRASTRAPSKQRRFRSGDARRVACASDPAAPDRPALRLRPA